MAVYTRLITPSFGARVEYEDRFAADFQNTIVRRFSRDPAQLRFYAAAHCYPSTYLHARARSRQRGPLAPKTMQDSGGDGRVIMRVTSRCPDGCHPSGQICIRGTCKRVARRPTRLYVPKAVLTILRTPCEGAGGSVLPAGGQTCLVAH